MKGLEKITPPTTKPYDIHSIEINIKNASGVKIYKPSLVLGLENTEQVVSSIVPEWLNYRYTDGWIHKSRTKPPSPDWNLYHYRLKDLETEEEITQLVKLLILKSAKTGKYDLHFSAQGYVDGNIKDDSWIYSDWIEWSFEILRTDEDFK